METVKAIIALILGLFVTATPTPTLIPTPTPTPTPIIPILKVSTGTARVDSSTLTAPATYNLSETTTITTQANSLATIDYQLGTEARLGPDTTVVYKNSTNLSQTIGQIYVRFKKVLGIRDSFSIDTPTAIATVRGTSFAVFVNSNKQTKLLVTESQVSLSTKTSPPTIALITAGQEGTALPGSQEIATSSATPSFAENAWLDYNSQLDTTGSADLSQTIFRPTLTPTATPTPKATPTPFSSPKPTAQAAPPLQGPPSSGLSTASVQTPLGNFKSTILSVDLSSTRMVTDTVEESNCSDNCPVSNLKDIVTKNGGFAGVNGVYFCPDTYPDCQGKKNSHDFPVFNSRLRRWIPDNTLSWGGRSALYVEGGQAQYLQNSAGIGGGMESGLINFPGLVDPAGNVQIDDNQSGTSAKQSTRSTKVGIGRIGGNKIIVVISSNVNMREFAEVFKSLGSTGAVNLDSGGSTALYHNGRYVFGPGRNLPTAIVFVKK